jgi:hypothetical protein
MTRRLRTFVHVGGVAYGPDDEVPAEVAEQIGDHAWADEDGDQDDGDETRVGFEDPRAQQSPTPTSGGTGEAPPRSGRGSGRDAWVAYAEANGLDVGEDRTREQIIADLEERGVIEREE